MLFLVLLPRLAVSGSCGLKSLPRPRWPWVASIHVPGVCHLERWDGWVGMVVPLLQRLMWSGRWSWQPGGQAHPVGASALCLYHSCCCLSAKEAHEQVKVKRWKSSLHFILGEEWQVTLAEGIQIGMGRFILQTMCHTPQFFPFSVSFRNIVKFSRTHLLTLF